MTSLRLHPGSMSAPPDIAVSTDGVRIHYRVFGRGGTAVVFIHGWSCEASYWHEQVPDVGRHRSAVLVDLAGHGDSGVDRNDWTMRSFGEDVAAVVDRLDHRRVILVGHSMGGGAMVEAARIAPGRITGLIGVDSMKSVGLPRMTAAALEERLAEFRRDFAAATRRIVREKLLREDVDHDLRERIALQMSSTRPEVAMQSFRAIYQWEYEPTLAALRAPIVGINAEHDVPTDMERLRRYIPGFRAVRMHGVGHFPMLESPQQFNVLLAAEIDRLDPPSPAA